MSCEFPPPVVLTIAGSDSSAGAGIQADLKTFSALGAYGLTAVTCVVAEVPGHVAAVHPVGLDVVRAQISLSLAAYPVAAIKTGLLHSRAVVETVAELYEEIDPAARPPLVVDPVMVATSGRRLLASDAVAAYRERLFPLAAVVTPNLDEARALLHDRPLPDHTALRDAGLELAARCGAAFLMKGGHVAGPDACDLLCTPQGNVHEYRAPFVRRVATHGTGCTYSAAIAARLARCPADLPDAIRHAKVYVTAAIAQSHSWRHAGRTTAALCHRPQEMIPSTQ